MDEGDFADVATQGEPEAGETKIEVTKQKLIVQEAVAVTTRGCGRGTSAPRAGRRTSSSSSTRAPR